jgi:hypothetical protein
VINQFQRREIYFSLVINIQGGVKINVLFCAEWYYDLLLCSVSSSVSQAFLQPILESFMNSELQVRLAALQAIILILRQGLVHPAQVWNGTRLQCM